MTTSPLTMPHALTRQSRDSSPAVSAPSATTPAPKIPPYVRAYVVLVAEHLAEGRRVTQRAAAQLLHVHETTLAKALARPGVQAWAAEALDALVRPAWLDAQIRVKVAHQALVGRTEQQRLWFELQGAIRQPAGQQASPTGIGPSNLTQIVIQVDGDPSVSIQGSSEAPVLTPRTNGGNGYGNGHI